MTLRPLATLAVLVLLPAVAAHEGHGGLDEELLRAGEQLLLPDFDAPQPGPLAVVPFVDAALPCTLEGPEAHLLTVDASTGVTVRSNATHVGVVFELPRPGRVTFAVDTHTAIRTLILMEEQAVAVHALAAWGIDEAAQEDPPELRSGELGIPYRIPGASTHNLGHGLQEQDLYLAYDAEPRGVVVCTADANGTIGLFVERAPLGDALAPGSIVHAVALVDLEVPVFTLRPLDSTGVLQLNLYLARPGEDPADVRASLAPAFGAREGAPIVLALAGIAWALVARNRS